MPLLPAWMRRRSDLYTSPADVIVYQDDNGYAYALDTKKKKIIAGPSTDHASVIQSAIDYLENGGKIYISHGTYTINNTIKLKDYITVNGSGYSTLLKLEDQSNCNVIENFDKTNGNSHIKIFNIRIDANNTNQDPNSVVRGISLTNCGNVEIGGVIITNTTRHGIYCSGCYDVIIHDNYLYNIGINNISGGDGIALSNCYRTIVSRNIIENTNDAGILVSGIWASSAISNNFVMNAYTGNIWIESGRYITITGNICWKNNNSSFGGIHISWDGTNRNNNIIASGNIIYGCYYGIRVIYTDDSRFVNNTIISPITSPVYTSNINNVIIRNNIGYVTENFGQYVTSGDGTTTQFSIPHGLVSTPNNVVVTPCSADAMGSMYVTVDSTNIYVNYSTAPPAGTNNVCLYWEAEI